MPLYEKRTDKRCGDCGHFVRHYIWLVNSFFPLHLGHCAHPRLKDRPEGHSCPLWTPREPGAGPTEQQCRGGEH